MTYGKLRQFRRDRLYASDRDRIGALTDMLRRSRVHDEQQHCHNATKQLKAVALQTRPIRERTGSTAIAPKERVLRKLAQLSNNKQQASTMITPTIIMGKL